jgi:hypothetical protein
VPGGITGPPSLQGIYIWIPGLPGWGLEHRASNPVSIKNLNATGTSAAALDGDRNYNDDISYGKDMIRNRKGRATEKLV